MSDSIQFPGRSTTSISRRRLLHTLALGGVLAEGSLRKSLGDIPPLPTVDLRSRDPDRYWERIRSEHFMLEQDRVFLNPGSLGALPRVSLEAAVRSLTRVAEFSTDEVPRWGYEPLEEERREMSEFLGCDRRELAFTHNCTASMSIVANGLDLLAGDEVLTTNQEHPGGSAPWHLRAARTGITRREVPIPVTPKSPGELIDRLISEIRPRTRVLSFSGITSSTGLRLPVKDICAAAREKGVLTVVDGAHMDGQVPVDLRDLGCDYFVGSPHKWMFAPPGCGILYGRGDRLNQLWPCVVTGGWDNKADNPSSRFMMIGTSNRSTIDGMIAGLRFFRALGPSAVYQRIHQLAQSFWHQAAQRSYLELVTPEDPQFYQAMVSIRFKSELSEALMNDWKKNRFYLLMGQGMRVSFHIYARPSDITKFFEICDRHKK